MRRSNTTIFCITCWLLLSCIRWVSAQSIEWIEYAGEGIDSGLINIGGDGYNDVAVDEAGNIYVTGFYSYYAYWNRGAATEVRLDTGRFGDRDMVIAKYDAQGVLQWIQTAEGGDHQTGVAIALSGDQVCVAGEFIRNIIIAPGTEDERILHGRNIPSDGVLLCHSQETGKLLWAAQVSSDQSIRLHQLVTDADGNLYLKGTSWGQVEFWLPNSNDVEAEIELPERRPFFAKYSANGEIQWVEALDGEEQPFLVHLQISNGDEIHLAGSFKKSLLLNAGKATEAFVGGFDEQKMFMARYNLEGIIERVAVVGEDTLSQGGVHAEALPTGGYFVAGAYSDSLFLGTLDSFYQAKLDAAYLAQFEDGAVKFFSENEDLFFASYDEEQNLRWAGRVGMVGSHQVRGVIYQDSLNIFIYGRFGNGGDRRGALYFNKDTENEIKLEGVEVFEGFVAKLNWRGEASWAIMLVGEYRVGLNHALLRPPRTLLLAGEFGKNLIVDGARTGNQELLTDGAGDAFLLSVDTEASLVGEETSPESSRVLLFNYPNPFARQTTIGYELDRSMKVNVSIYNVLGQRVQVLEETLKEQGKHYVVFEASGIPSGVYWCVLKTETQSQVLPLTILR